MPKSPTSPVAAPEPGPRDNAEQRVEEQESDQRAPHAADQRAVLGEGVRILEVYLSFLIADRGYHFGAIHQPGEFFPAPQLHPVRFRPIHVFLENHSNEALHGNTPYFVDSG